MRRDRWWMILALVAAPSVTVGQGAAADSLVLRVQRLVDAGNRDGARALADSALLVRTAGTQAYAEALFARGWASSDAAAAERDYVRVAVEYPFSPRVEEAMGMVAQLRYARGDRAGARLQYERLAQEFPTSPQAARHLYWAGRIALEEGALEPGCRALFLASERVPRSDVELRNQVDYLRTRCMMPTPSPVTPPESARTTPRDTVPPTPPVAARQEYSVQVAAYTRRRDAEAMAARLRARGFAVRVAEVGTNSPFKVRVGRYATRADAVAAQGRMRRQSRVNGIVVDAEPR